MACGRSFRSVAGEPFHSQACAKLLLLRLLASVPGVLDLLPPKWKLGDAGDITALRHRPLHCSIDYGVLSIEIGVEVLAFACLQSNYVWRLNGGNKTQRHTIDNVDGFARDVRYELLREAEDGTTVLHALLDKACQAAIEEGSEHFNDEAR